MFSSASFTMLTVIEGQIFFMKYPEVWYVTVKQAMMVGSTVSQCGKSISHQPQFVLMLFMKDDSVRHEGKFCNHVFCLVISE